MSEVFKAIGVSGKAEKYLQGLRKVLRMGREKPSAYVGRCWNGYLNLYSRSGGEGNGGSDARNLNGKIFECILAFLCVQLKLLPLYFGAKVSFVPNVVYDLIFYTKERGPVCWSAKTSLRERYKQADLEAVALKYVHRKSLSYLLTLEKSEGEDKKKKIREGEIIGLDDVIVATEPEFDELVESMRRLSIVESPVVNVVESNRLLDVRAAERLEKDFFG